MNKFKFLFLSAVFLFSATNIAYEILAATTLTILLGASIFYFSLTIGIYLASLGIGAWFSSKITENLTRKLIIIGALASFLGGTLILTLFGGLGLIFELMARYPLFSPKLIDAGFWAYNILAFLIISGIGVLAGFGLPLFSRALHQTEELKNVLGKVFFLDYFGSLVVSIMIPILLFPFIGLVRTSFLMGFFNALGVLMLILFLIYFEKKFLPNYLWLLFLAVLAVNIFGLALGGRIEFFLEQKQFGKNELLYYRQSPYQRIEFTKNDAGKIKFYLNGQHQFESGEWEKAYHESFAHPAFVLFENTRPLNVLILGGGDGLLLREILKYPQVKKVVLVDIDKAVIETSKNLEFMRAINKNSFFDPRVEVVIGDAFRFVWNRGENREKFDLIFAALPGPSDFGLVRLYSKEFYLNLSNILKTDGIGVIQSIGFSSPVHGMVIETLKAAGLSFLPYHPPADFFPPKNRYAFGYVFFSKNEIGRGEFRNKKIAVDTNVVKTSNLGDIFSELEIPKLITASAARANSIFAPWAYYDLKQTFTTKFYNSFRN